MTESVTSLRKRFPNGMNALRPVVLTLMTACAGNPAPLRPLPVEPLFRVYLCAAPAACGDSITVQFLGGAGLLLQERSRAPEILTGPSFSNPRLTRTLVPFFPMHPNRERIAASLNRSDLSHVSTILVGHGHYDHLFDVAPIARDYATHATIYGSASVFNTLQGDKQVAPRTINVEAAIGSATHAGQWIYVGDRRWRIMPLASSHAPNVWFVTFASGRQKTPRSSLPRTAFGWKMGTPLAWLIDYMGDDTLPRFRILYQDAASEPPFNVLPPLGTRDLRRVDLAILCVGNWNKAKNYPFTLLDKVDPRHVLLAHWDDFFRDPRKTPRVIALGNGRRLADTLDVRPGKDRWSTLSPKGKMQFVF